jgi:hypothetical protein
MSKTLPIILHLDIPKHVDEVFSFTKAVLATIMEHKELDLAQQRRVKMIMVELVTNSIKHSTDENSSIKLVIDHPTVCIEKFEKGLKIEFSSTTQQIPFEEIDKTIKISFSEENNHHIQTLDRYKFKFLNPFVEGLSLDQIPEHFGFYIITLASDSFVYQYDPVMKENRYTVNLNL